MKAPEPVVVKPAMMLSTGDCGITCLTMLLGVTYADVIRALPRKLPVKAAMEEGLECSQLIRVARKLGHKLAWREEPEEDEIGIVYLERTVGHDAHAALYLKGVIYNPADGLLYTDDDAFYARGQWKVEGFMRREDQ